uniref:Uncharacterized protein n=1 Tax=Aegilops tauschii TaxID=37682 RepID=M8CDS2_AEGTA
MSFIIKKKANGNPNANCRCSALREAIWIHIIRRSRTSWAPDVALHVIVQGLATSDMVSSTGAPPDLHRALRRVGDWAETRSTDVFEMTLLDGRTCQVFFLNPDGEGFVLR